MCALGQGLCSGERQVFRQRTVFRQCSVRLHEPRATLTWDKAEEDTGLLSLSLRICPK